MSTGNEKSALVPRRRFPGFQEGWRHVTVGDFFNLTDKSEKTTTFDKEKVLTVKLHTNGVVKNEKTTLTGGANYFNRRAGQFIFSKIDLLNGAFGVVPDTLDGFASSSDVPAYSFNAEQSPTFFVNWLKANYERIEIERTGTSSTLKRVSPDKFLALAVAAPIPAEQQKIADCLSSLDELIAAETQKLDALKTHKKSLMQQLFPHEGETVPRLRFPEFRDAGGWEEKALGAVCDMQAGKFVAASEISEKQADSLFPCFGGNGLRGYTKIYNQSGRYSLIGRQGALCGNVNLVDGDFYATEHAIVTTPKAGISTDWLFYNLCLLNLNQFATGQAQPGLSVEVLEKVVCVVPSNKGEQQKIADCLSSLDALITAQSQQIDALKTHKKGLMQQLFPVPDEVPA